ncbi:MAG: ABC transporter ATP-binding protein [Faecalibacterium sp.]|nr:ABC transporter ATP-binding protein [Faecalibacterium sp.]
MIEIANLTKIYNSGKPNSQTALDNVSFTVSDGELVAVIGKSGAGKSTLLNIVACLDTPTSGSVILDGEEISSASEKKRAAVRMNKLGIVTQTPLLVEEISAVENVKLPLVLKKLKMSECNQKAANLLKSVGLEGKIEQTVKTLSGGEKQRVSIARALASDPKIILADEPTGNLDTENASAVFNILKNVAKLGITVIVVTHDVDISGMCDRILELSDGKLKSDVSKTTA